MDQINDDLFYDSHIDEINTHTDYIQFDMSDIYMPGEEMAKGIIRFIRVNNILIDEKSSNKIVTGGDYGQILVMTAKNNVAEMTVDWHSFNPYKTSIHTYRFSFDRVEYEISDERYTIE